MAARALISNMAENSQQFSTRISPPTRSCLVVQSYQEEQQQMENRIDELTSLVRHMALGQQQPISNFYNPCWQDSPNFRNGHAPIQQPEHAFPSSTSFNFGWRDNPLFSNTQDDPTKFLPPMVQQPLAIQPAPQPDSSLHDLIKSLATQLQQGIGNLSHTTSQLSYKIDQVQQETKKDLEMKIDQLATSIHKLEKQHSTTSLPPQSTTNSKGKEVVNAIMCQPEPTLEELVKQMATNSLLFQQKIEATFQDLQNQIGQLASSMSELTTQVFDNLHSPSPTSSNLREHCAVIKLRSGKALLVPKNPSQVSKQVQESQEANSEKFPRDVQEEEEQNFEENFSKQNVGESQGKQQEKGDVLDPFMHAAFEFDDAFASDFGVHDSDFSAVSGFAAVSAFPNSEFSAFAANFDNYETKHVIDDHLLHSFDFVIQEDDSKLSRSKSDLRIAIGGMLMDEEEDYHDTLLDHERFQPFQAKDEKSFYIDPG